MSILMTLTCAIMLAMIFLFGRRFVVVPPSSCRGWISAAAGASIAYIFVDLLPELANHQQLLSTYNKESPILLYSVYLAALGGFILFYGLEHLVVRSRGEGAWHASADSIYRLNLSGFVCYCALVSYLVVHRMERGIASLLLYFVAMALHFLVLDHALRLEYRAIYSTRGPTILALAVMMGWLIAVLTRFPASLLAISFGFIAGGVVINSIKGELPREREGVLWPFVGGALGYAMLILAAG